MNYIIHQLSKIKLQKHQSKFGFFGKVLRVMTSYAVLIPLIVIFATFIYLILPPVRYDWVNQNTQLVGTLSGIAVSILLYGGLVLSLKIALHLIGINLSKDLEKNMLAAPQGLQTMPERRKALKGGTFWASAKQMMILKIVLIFLGLALIVMTLLNLFR